MRAEQRDRLLAAYGREHNDRGGFLLGLAAQYNRRTVFKQLARDQRAQNRMEMGRRLSGARPRIRWAFTARGGGKNRGEGLGVRDVLQAPRLSMGTERFRTGPSPALLCCAARGYPAAAGLRDRTPAPPPPVAVAHVGSRYDGEGGAGRRKTRPATVAHRGPPRSFPVRCWARAGPVKCCYGVSTVGVASLRA